MKPYRALCCDCLRGPVFETGEDQQRAHAGEIACVCGSSDMCACEDCLHSLRLLETGIRIPAAVGVNDGVNLAGWTASGGTV